MWQTRIATPLPMIDHLSQLPSEEQVLKALERVNEAWLVKYPNPMKIWIQNWDAICPVFKFSINVRKVIYLTNAIESLHSNCRNLNRQRSVFLSDTMLLKALYLATFEATKMDNANPKLRSDVWEPDCYVRRLAPRVMHSR